MFPLSAFCSICTATFICSFPPCTAVKSVYCMQYMYTCWVSITTSLYHIRANVSILVLPLNRTANIHILFTWYPFFSFDSKNDANLYSNLYRIYALSKLAYGVSLYDSVWFCSKLCNWNWSQFHVSSPNVVCSKVLRWQFVSTLELNRAISRARAWEEGERALKMTLHVGLNKAV